MGTPSGLEWGPVTGADEDARCSIRGVPPLGTRELDGESVLDKGGRAAAMVREGGTETDGQPSDEEENRRLRRRVDCCCQIIIGFATGEK